MRRVGLELGAAMARELVADFGETGYGSDPDRTACHMMGLLLVSP